MTGNPMNGDAPLAQRSERAPTAAWQLTQDLTLEQELEIREARLEGLDRQAEGDE